MMDPQDEARVRKADLRTYERFTGPQRLQKALHTLQGLLRGIAADGQVTPEELRLICDWRFEHREFANRHPFNEVMPCLDAITADGVVDAEELEDVLWLCDRLSIPNEYFGLITSDLQRLQGMLGGIIADGVITKAELEAVSSWADEHEHLSACWPFDEVRSVVLGVLRDGRIDADEHELLLALFREFTALGEHRATDVAAVEMIAPVRGYCAVCPAIAFDGRVFCFTGKSEKATRRELVAAVEQRSGSFSTAVIPGLHYLVIGAGGNPAWAFACYGRKVERAMTLRKQGRPIVLVHELDFWDAVADNRIN
jgi:hypothetical protein